MGYHHILIATDLSQETDKIADVAMSIAHRYHAKVDLVHVLQHTPIVYGGGEFSIPLDLNLEEQLTQTAAKALATLGTRIHVPGENQHVLHGSIKQEIIHFAEEAGVDLIVVGSHGHHGIEAFLGSTANAILHAAKCDVLAVRVK